MAREAKKYGGRPRVRARQRMYQDKGDVCFWCGHAGSQDLGHVIPEARGGAPLDPDNHAPIHGGDGCPTCARKCNQEQGDQLVHEVRRLKTSRDWYASPA